MFSNCLVILFTYVGLAAAFQSKISYRSNVYQQIQKTNIYAIPLELEGQLDASRKWDVTLEFNGVSKVVSITEGSSILDMAESVFDGVESSCRNGVCTTCAGKVEANIGNTVMAVNCLGKPQIDAGFVCTCQLYATGPGVSIKLGQMDECYEGQYGQFEKSYGELKFSDKNPPKEPIVEKKKGLFGW